MKKTYLMNWHQITDAGTYEGESIEKVCRRVVEEKAPITDGAPIIYTPKDAGVLPAYDIRTDRWDMAIIAMDAVNKQRIAQSKQSPEKKENQKEVENKQANDTAN